ELVFEVADTNRIAALLNADSNEVGRVHLGIVHVIDVENTRIAAGEVAVASLGFLDLVALQGSLVPYLETWYQHVIRVTAQREAAASIGSGPARLEVGMDCCHPRLTGSCHSRASITPGLTGSSSSSTRSSLTDSRADSISGSRLSSSGNS